MKIVTEQLYEITADKNTQVLLETAPLSSYSALAIEALENAKQKPHDYELWIKYSEILRRQGLHREALDAVSNAIMLTPFDWQPYLMAGYDYIMMERFSEAVVSFETAVRINEESFESYLYGGIAASLSGLNDLSIYNFKRALFLAEYFEDYYETLFWYAIALIKSGHQNEIYYIFDEKKTFDDADTENLYYIQTMHLMSKGDSPPQKLCTQNTDIFLYCNAWRLIKNHKKKEGATLLFKCKNLTPRSIVTVASKADWNAFNRIA